MLGGLRRGRVGIREGGLGCLSGQLDGEGVCGLLRRWVLVLLGYRGRCCLKEVVVWRRMEVRIVVLLLSLVPSLRYVMDAEKGWMTTGVAHVGDESISARSIGVGPL